MFVKKKIYIYIYIYITYVSVSYAVRLADPRSRPSHTLYTTGSPLA